MTMSPEVVTDIIVTLREHGDAALNFIGRLEDFTGSNLARFIDMTISSNADAVTV